MRDDIKLASDLQQSLLDSDVNKKAYVKPSYEKIPLTPELPLLQSGDIFLNDNDYAEDYD